MSNLIEKTLNYIKACMESDGMGLFGIVVDGEEVEVFLPETVDELFLVYDWVGRRVFGSEEKKGIYVSFLNVRGMASETAVALLCWNREERETRIYPYRIKDCDFKILDERIYAGHLADAIEVRPNPNRK